MLLFFCKFVLISVAHLDDKLDTKVEIGQRFLVLRKSNFWVALFESRWLFKQATDSPCSVRYRFTHLKWIIFESSTWINRGSKYSETWSYFIDQMLLFMLFFQFKKVLTGGDSEEVNAKDLMTIVEVAKE